MWTKWEWARNFTRLIVHYNTLLAEWNNKQKITIHGDTKKKESKSPPLVQWRENQNSYRWGTYHRWTDMFSSENILNIRVLSQPFQNLGSLEGVLHLHNQHKNGIFLVGYEQKKRLNFHFNKFVEHIRCFTKIMNGPVKNHLKVALHVIFIVICASITRYICNGCVCVFMRLWERERSVRGMERCTYSNFVNQNQFLDNSSNHNSHNIKNLVNLK